MQSREGNNSKDDYIKLIEYLKLNFTEGTIYTRSSPEEYKQLKEEVETLFDIDVFPIQTNRSI